MNKVILISGGTSGIGKEIVITLLNKGHKVATFSRTQKRIEELKSALENKFDPANFLIMQGDVTSTSDLRKVTDSTIEKFGTLDVVINNAGVCFLFECDSFDLEEVNKMIQVNLVGVMNFVKITVPHFKKKKSGLYINISSVSALEAIATGEFYSATKFALKGYSEGLREELSDFGIKVGNIYPGPTDTEIWNSPSMSKYKKDNPDMTFLTAVEVAKCVESMIDQAESSDIKDIEINPS